MGNLGEQLAVLAQRLWDNFFHKKVRETQKSMLRQYRAQVTTAAANGKIGVKRPFDSTETFLPYVSSMETAPVGAQVVVMVFGEGKNAANHMIFMYADGRSELGGTGVKSFNGRIGSVVPQTGDYTKEMVGLGNVDNTSDADKPISTATETALQTLEKTVDEKIGKNMTAEATGLPAGSAPTVSYDSDTNKMSFGIPAGTNGKDGTDGITPTIGANGNWYLGDTDTGKPSRGEPGKNGSDANVTESNITAALGYKPGNYSKPEGGIPKTDLSSGVQASLDKADGALQKIGSDQISTIGFENGALTIDNDGSKLKMTPVTRIGAAAPNTVKFQGSTIYGTDHTEQDVILNGIADGTGDNDAATVRQLKNGLSGKIPVYDPAYANKMLVRDGDGYIDGFDLAPSSVGAMPKASDIAGYDATANQVVNNSKGTLQWAQFTPIVSVEALPENPDANTLYLIKEGSS